MRKKAYTVRTTERAQEEHRMRIVTVGPSEREYYEKGKCKAYIVLNGHRGFTVYENCGGGNRFSANYKTYRGARNYLTRLGYSAIA